MSYSLPNGDNVNLEEYRRQSDIAWDKAFARHREHSPLGQFFACPDEICREIAGYPHRLLEVMAQLESEE